MCTHLFTPKAAHPDKGRIVSTPLPVEEAVLHDPKDDVVDCHVAGRGDQDVRFLLPEEGREGGRGKKWKGGRKEGWSRSSCLIPNKTLTTKIRKKSSDKGMRIREGGTDYLYLLHALSVSTSSASATASTPL